VRNKAAMLNHIWNLFAQSSSLWIAWVEDNWLKGRSFWRVFIPHPCPWSWRKILKLRKIAKDFIHLSIGDGARTFLWYDNWHPDGHLIEKYGYRAIYDAGSNVNARVSYIIRNGDWFWPSAHLDNIVAIQCRLSEVEIGAAANKPIWKSKNVNYSYSDTWDLLRER
jgi:hypothetical protein